MIVLRDDPEVVPDAIRLARATFRAIRRNLACSYNRQYPEVFVSEGCGVLSLAPTGQHRLVPCFNNLGRIQDSQFTPLPGIPGQAGCWSTAW